MSTFKTVFILLIISIQFGCSPCYHVECTNGGTCVNGRCMCSDGTERPICNMDLCLDAVECPAQFPCAYGICQCPDTLFGNACQFRIPNGVVGYYEGEEICAGEVFGDEVEYEVYSTDDPTRFVFDEGRSRSEFYIQFTSETDVRIPEQKVKMLFYSQIWVGTGTFIEDQFVLNVAKGKASQDTCTITIER